ncbi:glycosyltransferase family 1 protein [Peribacillus butanolivorans]|uniref:glycosyltransferase family 1 protein n=1 Tax=Peribacillus butanolivorans TaxID=421767 RepID=UPI0038015A6B
MNKEQPIRVLHIVSVMNRAGIETFLMNVYRKIDRTKVQFDFLVTREEVGIFDEEIKLLGGIIYNIPHIKKVGLTKYRKNVNDFFSNKNSIYKIVHCHMNTWAGFFLPIAKKNNIPTRIAHSHSAATKIQGKTTKDYFEFIFKKYNSLFIKNSATQFFACSKKAGDSLYGKDISNSNLEIINNAIDVESFRFNKEVENKLRGKLEIPTDTYIVGHVGRFNKVKNHEVLIDIFKEINKKEPNSILCLVGDGELKSEIKKKVSKLGLGNSVKFLGLREDVNELMMIFDVLLFPSIYEGLPVTIIEAQASGLPSVISNSITNEVDLKMGLVDFVSLNKTSEYWSKIVLTKRNIERNMTISNLFELGYDTQITAKKLQDFYLAQIENKKVSFNN